jgi:hypothetical protein
MLARGSQGKAYQVLMTLFAEKLTSSGSLCQNFTHKLSTSPESKFA